MSVIWAALKSKWFPPADTHPSFTNRNILITGANTGIGFEAALKFVQLGAHKVILGVRTLSKGEEAKRRIEERTGRLGGVEVWHLDMLDYTTIKTFADRATNELDHLDVAVLNAGVLMGSYKTSAYGFEQTMQVHVLSTALLALLLLPKLKASKTESFTPVLEMVGASNHYLISELHSETESPFAAYNSPELFSPWNQDMVSKLFLMYVQKALVSLANDEDGIPQSYIPVVCPGPTQSQITRDFTAWYLQPLKWLLGLLVQRTAEEAARTYISGVCQCDETHGRFWRDDKVIEPAPLLVGERGEKLQKKVWTEIVQALKKDVPELDEFIRR